MRSEIMKIAVISPHPDDETLGAGGTLLRYKAQGNRIYWINVTDVEKGRGWDDTFVSKRREQIRRICQFYQFDGFYNLRFQPGTLEQMDKRLLIDRIGGCFREIQPDWIILPDANDAHSDHRIVFESCMACSKVFRYPYIRKITTMEILSETDFGRPDGMFVPNYLIDISSCMEEKINALLIYDTEICDPPFPRSVEAVKALGTVRGGMAGVRYAEAFKLIKSIE